MSSSGSGIGTTVSRRRHLLGDEPGADSSIWIFGGKCVLFVATWSSMWGRTTKAADPTPLLFGIQMENTNMALSINVLLRTEGQCRRMSNQRIASWLSRRPCERRAWPAPSSAAASCSSPCTPPSGETPESRTAFRVDGVVGNRGMDMVNRPNFFITMDLMWKMKFNLFPSTTSLKFIPDPRPQLPPTTKLQTTTTPRTRKNRPPTC